MRALDAVHLLALSALTVSAFGSESAATKPAAPAAAAESKPAAADTSAGAKLYAQACATCHMPDGSGVPGMQPALVGSKIAGGPPATLVRVLLLGPAKALPPHPKVGANEMPAFDSLSNEEIAAVASY